jgi:hypothetical protein
VQPVSYAQFTPVEGLHLGAREIHLMAKAGEVITQGKLVHQIHSIQEAQTYCLSINEQLQTALMVPDSDPDSEYLHSWVDRVGSCDPADIFHQMGQQSVEVAKLDLEDVSLIKFSPQLRPPNTTAAVYGDQQLAHCYLYQATSLSDLLIDTCHRDLIHYINQTLRADLYNIAFRPLERQRPPPFIRGQSCFQPQARGCIWDLRRIKQGSIIPLKLRHPLISQLHQHQAEGVRGIEYINQMWKDWPDQRLISYLNEGVLFEVGSLPLQIVIAPHLVSLPEGFFPLQEEVERMQLLNWVDIFDAIPPFLPIRSLRKGKQERHHEANRPRLTTDAGDPRRITADDDGIPVESLNFPLKAVPASQRAETYSS